MEKTNKIIDLLENGQHKEAIEEYNEVLKSGVPEEKFLLAERLMQYGFLQEAIALFENLLLYYPGEGEIIVLLAEAYVDIGEEEKAILLLEEIEADDPSYGEALILLADLYQLQGLYEVSERKLRSAKEALPDETVVDFALAELYSSMGGMKKAIEFYEKVLKSEDEFAGVSIHQRLAECLSASGAFEDAMPHYEKALENRVEINTLFGCAFTALQAGYNRTAIERFEELKHLDPEYHSLYLHLAHAYEREEMLDNALQAVTDGIRKDDFNKDLHYFGGKLALKLGRQEEAEQLLREALALDPGFTEAALILNKLFIHQERYEDVIDLIQAVDMEEHAEPQFHWDAAVAFEHLEEYGKARENYEAAYPYFKNNENFMNDYGYFLIEEGKTALAAEIFKELLRRNPVNAEYADLVERLSQN
ncbi:tetratricopeptide repeat protein [Neobacillus sp. YIM B06451]|uniref:tetratricopeptide repeat protein n=1 Tax=Neobacillus sp. YIM B06451 TaxID=3070994 RepID=UPI0029319A74|nr:tetratricopeptide repeat protein [Neobacillus sp. YIM B06451]